MSARDSSSLAPDRKQAEFSSELHETPDLCPEIVPAALTKAQLAQRAKAHRTHGIYARSQSSLKLGTRKVRRLKEKARVVMPWLAPSDEPALTAWAMLYKRFTNAFVALERNDQEDAGRLQTEFRLMAQTLLSYETALGMTPAARASLGLKIAVGRQVNAATELAQLRAEQEGPHGPQ